MSPARAAAARKTTAGKVQPAKTPAAKATAGKVQPAKASARKTPAAKATAAEASAAKASAGSGQPALGPPVRASLPTVAERTLDNGLRVVVVRRPTVPLVEIRLRIPFAARATAHLAQASVLGETFFAGTDRHDAHGLAAAIQSLGGGFGAGTDADRLMVTGSGLAPQLGSLLELLAELLTGNRYPAGEVAGERERIVEELTIARTTPATLAGEAVSRRMFGTHPYSRGLPTAEEVRAVTPAALRRLHERRVAPAGAVLVLVGDVSPQRALAAAEKALSGWHGDDRKVAALPPLPAFVPGGITLVDRPGSVQTSLRVVATAPRRTDPDYAALVIANTAFAGYFSSRLVANIREDKGYTYSPHSLVTHSELGSALEVDADVATEVTAPALNEVFYEMSRVATLPITQAELDAARRYLVGSQALGTASQAGLATLLARLVDAGLSVSWLRDYPAALGRVTVDAAFEAASTWLAPAVCATVLVGDAGLVSGPVGRLGPLTPMTLD